MDELKYLSIVLCPVGMGLAAYAIGNIFSGFFAAISRNPETEKMLSKNLYVGMAMAESLGLFCFVAMLLVFFT